MLLPEDFDAWLNGAESKDMLCKTLPELQDWIVSTQVNKAGQGDDDLATIAPVSDNPARL
jgi:putative SOS response-associated peptidase YedK